MPRRLTLTLGTVLIIGICYAFAAPVQTPPSVANPQGLSPVPRDAIDLTQQCELLAEQLRQQSEEAWAVHILPPFVLAGDLSVEQIELLAHDTIVPTARALQIDYFDREPGTPITVLMFGSETSYRRALEQRGQSRRAEYSGLYQRKERTVLLNLATGTGTLAHELTHALAHADFPQLPEWLDEGLASLHEEAEFSSDGLHLLGRDNWRMRFLLEADERRCWKPIGELLERPFAEPDCAALDYALARSLCQFLQERGLLSAYYRKCRHGNSADPTGRAALARIFPGQSFAEIERDFRAWVLERR